MFWFEQMVQLTHVCVCVCVCVRVCVQLQGTHSSFVGKQRMGLLSFDLFNIVIDINQIHTGLHAAD